MADHPGRGSRGSRLIDAARRFNRDPKLVERARTAREQTLGDDQFVDLVSTSRGRRADVAVHRLATLRGDDRGLMGEIGLTALQAWQRLAESKHRGKGKAEVAILFTDLCGFSAWALEAGDAAAVELLREFTRSLEEPISARQGEVVKHLGDGLMAAFWDAAGAVDAALAATRAVAAIDASDYRPRLRTGVHLGRPRRMRGDYFGVDVNIAARLADAATPGQVLVSGPTFEALPAGSVEAKKCRFAAKGVPKGLPAYSIRSAD
jgi:adenylate cyclase